MKNLPFFLILVCIPIGFAQESSPIPAGIDTVTQLDRLPLLRHGVWFHATSSQDVTGGNNDGFTAAFSNQYVEDGRFVLLDRRGPACIQLFRTARNNAFTNKMAFEADAIIETRRDGKPHTEVVSLNDMYSGERAPFLAPLVRDERKAHGVSWNFVPICSEDGIKVSLSQGGPMFFFDVFYYSYLPETAPKGYTPQMEVTPALERWKAVGEPLDPRPSKPATRKMDLSAHSTVPVWSSAEPGTVTAIRLKLEYMTPEALRHVRIKAYWDGEVVPSVDSPLGPFFGTGYWPVPDPPDAPVRYGVQPKMLKTGNVELGRTETRSLPVGATKDGFYNFFPMPFLKSARIDLVNESNVPVPNVEMTVHAVAGAPTTSSAQFHAQWRQENPTLPFRDYTVLETQGHGHYVGAVLIMSSIDYNPAKPGEGQRGYLEGDGRYYIDGNRTFVNGGTGTEECFLWGWYDLASMDKVFSYAVSGYPVHEINSQDHTVMYRFHLSDIIPYYRSFRFALEHGPEGNMPTNYSSTAFYYQVNKPSLQMTDELSLGDASSVTSHAYSADKVMWQGCRDLPFEGDRQILFTEDYKKSLKEGTQKSFEEAVHACGQRATGAVEFTAAILPDNKGTKLRRLMDYAPPDIPGQEEGRRKKPLLAPGELARVFVDGASVGEWYQPARHARLAWLEDEFEIPAKFTTGKKQVKIRLEVAPESSWSAFQYRVYSYR